MNKEIKEMTITQISVYMENKPGKLAKIVSELSKAGINIRAMSLADTSDFGLVRLIVSDLNKARDILQEMTLVFCNKVLAVEMDDRSGALSVILNALNEGDVNVEYMYAFVGKQPYSAYAVMQVDDMEKAERILENRKIRMLCEEDLINYTISDYEYLGFDN
ncbi:MAG: ACT domain-containing protein [Bacillota bacterium]|nr:ACT domain-containing protein [Bacillota bacterium]